jgi:hypothetical protein
MEIIAKHHAIDHDQIELYSDDMKWLLGVIHVDSFQDMPKTQDRLIQSKEAILRLEEV